MANVYQAKLSDGTSYDVTTNRDHANHDDKTFKQHLLDIIKDSSSEVIAGTVLHFALKKRV